MDVTFAIKDSPGRVVSSVMSSRVINLRGWVEAQDTIKPVGGKLQTPFVRLVLLNCFS